MNHTPALNVRHRRRGRGRGERGETLIESIIAIMMLSVVAIAAYAGLSATIKSGTSQRTNARSEILLRAAAEQLQNPDLAYIARAGCPGSGRYTVAAPASSDPGFSTEITAVSFWSGASATPTSSATLAFSSTCPASASTDPGLQRISIRVTDASSGAVSTMSVVKRRP